MRAEAAPERQLAVGTCPSNQVRSAYARDLLAPAASLAYTPNSEVFGQGEKAETVCRVLTGAVRAVRLLADGRRQVTAFYLPGEVFGLESDASYSYSAEAIGRTSLQIARRAILLERAQDEDGTAASLWRLTAEELQRTRAHLFLLGRRTARERVAAFLLDIRRRGGQGDTVRLPMRRRTSPITLV